MTAATFTRFARVAQDSPLSHWSGPGHAVLSEVIRRAVADSADYADAQMGEELCIRGDKKALWAIPCAMRADDSQHRHRASGVERRLSNGTFTIWKQ